MSKLLINNARLILPDGVRPGGLMIRDGKIAGTLVGGGMPSGFGANESIDLNGAYVAPGLIDIHIHGSAGIDVQATDVDGLKNLSEFLGARGITGYFPTFVPADDEGYRSALSAIRKYVEQTSNESVTSKRPQAKILGVHFEGPFVNHNRCGALKRQYFRSYGKLKSSADLFEKTARELSAISLKTLMTLAPEVDGGIDLIRKLTAAGVRAFIGHSQADRDVLNSALESGASHITHFPNALEPLHHRKPGAIAWGLLNDEVTIDCIADFQHVDPMMLMLMRKAKGTSRLGLISDAIKPTGLGDGEFDVWDERVLVRSGRTTLVGSPQETIAGSVITILDALRNMIGLGVPLWEAVGMASQVPARAAGIEAGLGSIAVGKRADLVVFTENLEPIRMILGGVPVAN